MPAEGAVTLVTDGWTAAAAPRLKKGDVFTIANVNAVNPLTKQSTGLLRQFVVTADVSSDGSGNATIGIYPAIYSSASGALQNVSALPADNAAITVLGAANTVTPAQIVAHQDAFTLACVDMPLPKGMDMAARASSKQAGLSIRFVRGFDITNDRFISRLDIVYGFAALYPEWSCRVQG